MYIEVKKCRCCGNSNLEEILDLGEQPLANSYHKKDEVLIKFPLKLMLCDKCLHSQLSIVVNPDLMFKNYLYTSGTSKTLNDYFSLFAHEVMQDCEKDTKVLDIACNDGTQLDYFRKLGAKTYGVDPAENLCTISSKKGHIVVNDYWNENSFMQLSHRKPFDIIIAQNVFAHVHDLVKFLNLCKLSMHQNSVLYIQTSQCNMFKNFEFDTIYHEHLSYFSVNSMNAILDKHNLYISDVTKVPVHGKSFLFTITQNKNNQDKYLIDWLEQEWKDFDDKIYKVFSLASKKIVMNLYRKIYQYKTSEEKYKIIGFGAAAKGNTLLNFGNIKLDYIVDDNPLKWGLYTPGTDILIKNPDELLKEKDERIVFVPLAWNFYDEIYKKVKQRRPNNDDIFIKYFPELEILK